MEGSSAVGVNTGGKPPLGLSGSVLKWLAIITMFIDHIGASLLEVYVMDAYGNSPYHGFRRFSYEKIMACYQLDMILRCIGRLAFPIFCFLLVEGFMHTRNVKKYALRLGLFCLISELPFNLAFQGKLFAPQYQNVFFTLLLGLLGIWGCSYFREKKQWIFAVLSLVLAAGAAELLQTDYSAFGVIFIELQYLFYKKKIFRTIVGVLCLILYGGIEMCGAFAFLPICFYNGTRGTQPKYFFYIFYPAHLLLIVTVGRWILPAVF